MLQKNDLVNVVNNAYVYHYGYDGSYIHYIHLFSDMMRSSTTTRTTTTPKPTTTSRRTTMSWRTTSTPSPEPAFPPIHTFATSWQPQVTDIIQRIIHSYQTDDNQRLRLKFELLLLMIVISLLSTTVSDNN